MSCTSTTQSDSRDVVACDERSDSIGRSGSRCRCRLRNVVDMQTRPVQAVYQRGELRGGEPHHTIADRWPAERVLLQTFPQHHQSGSVPNQNLQTVRSLRTEDKNRSRERIMAELLRHQRSETVGTFAEVHRLRRDHDLHARRSRDHVAALTARSTSRSHAGSTPTAARTTAPPISMLIVIELRVDASVPSPAPRSSVTTGTKRGASSAGRLSTPARAALRHTKRCCGEMPCRRATSDTTAPGAYDSATIRPLTSSLHRRRRPAPTWISTRPRGFEASTISSTMYANRTVCDGSYLAGQLAPDKVGAENRLRSRSLSPRTTAPPISMLIVVELRAAASAAGPAPRSSVTTGTKSGASSAGRLSTPARAALRPTKRCCGEIPCRRATSDTTAPGAYDSATIRPLTSSLHRRRRPAPTWISTRPRGFEASTISSTMYANRTVCDGSYLAGQLAPDKVGAENRLRWWSATTAPSLPARHPDMGR